MPKIIPLLLSAFLFLAGCDSGKPPVIPVQDAAWSRLISAHSSGMISRKSSIRVVFANDITTSDRIGQDASGHLKTKPSVKGNIRFASQREIVLTPEDGLEQGTAYHVRVDTEGLLNMVEKLKTYEFMVQVQPQQFEVNVNGLVNDTENNKALTLNGYLVTADVEEAAKIESLLKARHQNNDMTISWNHNVDARHHDFVITGIQRTPADSTVTLTWDGSPIGVNNQGERTLDVPGLSQFKVMQANIANEDQQPFIQVFFSDVLKANQNLQGLIRLGSNVQTTQRIEGNILKIYPDRGLQGEVLLTLEPGIRNNDGEKTTTQSQHPLTFVSSKPQVRFVGKGVILPDSKVLSIPFEAVNVRSVRITAMRIYDNNVGQFLQVNKLDGNQELSRVGRTLWRKTIPLSATEANKWQRHHLDVTELFQKHPGGLFRLTLSITKADSVYPCSGDTAASNEIEAPPSNAESLEVNESSSWDYAEEYYNPAEAINWNERANPCSNSYYRLNANRNYYYGNQEQFSIRDERNFLASNIGLLAKRDPQGRMLVVATDLRTSAPLKDIKINAMNFQNQVIASETTDNEGMARFKPGGSPFYLLAEKDGQKGYLKVAQGVSLPISHFDVGGEKITAGIKGFIYGERGVWRPGDEIYLTFVLQDKDKSLPANHPVTMELRDPKGQLVQTLINASPVGELYKFTMRTDETATTGDWTAKAIMGGASFSKTIKVETVMPNRLKVGVELAKKLRGGEPLSGTLAAQWLTGASAAGLKGDVELRLNRAETRFDRYTDFNFEDPARTFSAVPTTIFEGELDDKGEASFEHDIALDTNAPGMLTASLTSRVFERGGAFSINRQSMPYSPYAQYIGIKLPKGDASRNMLLTDKKHIVEIASLASDGKPVTVKKVQVTLYKIGWKWWWDQSGESLANFASSSHASKLLQSTVATSNGKGSWEFEIKYPDWGRYLVRACDISEGEEEHCTGSTLYIDWPGWAGRPQEQSGPGASMLALQSDKQKYSVGDKAVIQLPEASQGRALVTVENGAGILDAHWIEFAPGQGDSKEKARFELPITRAMAPNVYVSVALIQPHEGKNNDLPIRLYGVIPIHVTDPKTVLRPQIHAAEEWQPETKVSLDVSEENGQAMSYTLAVVDEGLLGLTNFNTPDLHGHFYRREALGITTWDLFDEVAGAYGASLDRLLALGGSDADAAQAAKREKKRFPPVVKYLGPFKLAAGERKKHEILLPPYVGSLRAMVVAAEVGGNDSGSAYGSAEKSIYVRQPLMILPTLPRVVGPEEEFSVPVSLFVMDKGIKEVSLKLETGPEFQLADASPVTVTFSQPDEKLGVLKLKSNARLGKGRLKITASSGKHRAQAEVFLEIRSPNPPSSLHQRKALLPGETWEAEVIPHGLPGTNTTTLEISGVPPLDLERHLHYLIQYPHGCVEQTTSSAFPQLYLASLVKLEDSRKMEIEKHMLAAFHRLRGYQLPNGAFGYWPGGFNSGFDGRNAWSTNYAGHFLVEASKLGYQVPSDMLTNWKLFQKTAAQAWTAGGDTSALDQAYRLYTLALANQPEVGAMNRLRETPKLPSTARWMLAAAYKLAGQSDAASSLVKGDPMTLSEYAQPDVTFGSRLRDAAIVLNSLVILNQLDQAKPLVDEISSQLSSERWHSTQTLAYSLMAMSKFVGNGKIAEYSFERSVLGKTERFRTGSAIHTDVISNLPDQGTKVKIKNTSERTLYATLVTRGIPKSGGDEAASSGLSLEVAYKNEDGAALDLTQLRQGQDAIATVTVKNISNLKLENLALTQMVAATYEINNERMEGAGMQAGLEHMDIRDDRVLRYFALRAGESMTFTTRLNAAYLGNFYQPGIQVEAMYDATRYARTKGQWIQVTTSAK